jgi:ribonuclease-3
MAKWYGTVGYVETKETAPDVWTSDEIVERQYYGDVMKNHSRWESKDQLNDDLRLNNQISILADAYEAVLGAVYLDGGLDEVRAILNKFHFPRVQEIISAEDFINHKSELLEYLQGKLRTVPEYVVVDESGPEHQKVFTVEVHVDGRVYGRGQGGNKKKAEQEASRVSLEMLLAEAAKAEAEKGPEEPKPKKQKQRHVGLP